jgi:hypothetical protein
MDSFIGRLINSTQRNYKAGWNLFIVYLISISEPFPNWEDEDFIIIFEDFIIWKVREE